jgi:hypothetical protein
MNRQEQRALRDIEKNLAIEDPKLAELLRASGRNRWSRIHRYALWIAVPFALLGFALGDVTLLVTAGLVVSGAAAIGWAMAAHERHHRRDDLRPS